MNSLKYSVKVSPERPFRLAFILFALLLTSFHNYSAEPGDDYSAEPGDDDKFVVVLDAGHGGHDPGNLGNGYYEKNIALNIVLNAGALLEKNPDIKVIYTRKDDTFVDLYVRGEIANKAGADLFVSVHCDSHTSQAHGAGTFVLGLHANKQNFEIAKKENSVIYLEDDYKDRYADYDINSPESVIGLTIMQEEFLDQSIALAKDIQDNFVKMDRVDRKVKQAGFIVLHQTVMPSVLVETGFLTNDDEGAFLDSKKGQSQMGEAIGKAILTYKESAMANMADFNPIAMAEAPNPDADISDTSDAANAAENSREPRKKSRQEKKRAAEKERKKANSRNEANSQVTERDAGTASTKETAQIIEEAQAQSQKGSITNEGAGSNSDKTANTGISSNPVTGSNKNTDSNISPNSQIAGNPPTSTKGNNDKISEASPEIVFKVQIMASSKNLALRPASFNGLNRVAQEPFNNLYRYVYGSTSSLREAEMLKSNADVKGYPSSFIVVYRDGKRITFKESKEYLTGQ